ncbi:mediator-associated protein 2 [Tripterygium wilfordii]|uniref:Mediator-associated protein 2 n=1 Tax=Tripterygium wilfordii TaxID=458696 RepID=A0A7J7DJW1_TRIWF|nr:mediator-associated protein 2 [Tripterygium wilfordii]KAF5746366.1 mediator-associated protein 2 [Tripterygium wilfordii]
MHGAVKEGYEPPKDFEEDTKEPLVDLQLTDSTELWLIQWPSNQTPDFDGMEVTLDLNRDGRLGTFEGSSGKEYDVVGFAAQEPDATVFLSSASEAKIVGKIARRVSFVHYPDPEELTTQKPENVKQLNIKNSGTTYTGSQSRLVTPSRNLRNSATTHSRHKSSSSKLGNSPSNKRRHVGESSGSKDRSIRSAYTSSGASMQSR